MVTWTFSDLWESVAAVQPDHPAFIQGDRVVKWSEFEAQSDALAADFLKAGLTHQSKVAAYLYNCPEYVVAYHAAFKAGLAPFNTNYRYGAEELFYLFDNADAEAIVFDAEFTERLEPLRARLTKVKRWIAVPSAQYPVPDWAADYNAVTASPPAQRPVRAPWGRHSEDVLIVYTGGTTGMPKGVMWMQADIIGLGGYGGNLLQGKPPLESPQEAGAKIVPADRPVTLVACPLMHGTGQLSAMGALTAGGTVLLLPSRRFDAAELWDQVHQHRATTLIIVGLAFCAPMLDALEAEPKRWDVSSVRGMTSSGAMWSYENKQGLLRHLAPGAMLMDGFSSSEAIGMGASVSTAGGEAQTAKFVIGPSCAVFSEDYRRIEPGSGERGMVAVTGFLPLGYYKDPEKTAKTFPIIEGQRWSIPGDWAEVNTDGTLNLLGRGSQCINTGGEKVFPEEVEEALKRHPSVRDAAVVGLPDVRFGERICAVVELQVGVAEPCLSELQAHVRTQLADYKAPRHLVLVPTVGRAPNGKLDYKAVKQVAVTATSDAAA